MIVQRKFKISSEFTELRAVYTAGALSYIEIVALTDFLDFMRIIEQLNEEPTEIEGCRVRELKVNAQKQKIALWCQLYKMQYGNDYKVTPREAGMLKNIEVTQELVTGFLNSGEWWAKEKTIQRYTSNYNELKRISNNQQRYSGKSNGSKGTDFSKMAEEFQKRYSK